LAFAINGSAAVGPFFDLTIVQTAEASQVMQRVYATVTSSLDVIDMGSPIVAPVDGATVTVTLECCCS
jgi:hypothetical protein